MKATSNLQSEILRQGRKMQDLASLVDLTPAQFSHVANGNRSIDWAKAAKIAGAMGWPLFFLFEAPTGTNETPNGEAA